MDLLLMKHCRQIAGITQKELAESIFVHDSLISKIEAGTVPIQPDTLKRMLKVFADKGITETEIALLETVFESRKLKRRYSR